MKIGINASFVRKPDTGIGQVTLNFLRKLGELKAKNGKLKNCEIILYLEEDLPKHFELPEIFSKKIFLPVYKRDDLLRKIWWEKYLIVRHAKKDKCDIFLSLYQCPTFFEKNKYHIFQELVFDCKHIMIVHDIVPKLFPEYLNNSRKKIYWKLTEETVKKTDCIVAVSHRTEKDLIQHLGVDAKKITVAHIDVADIFKKSVSPENSTKIMEKYNLAPGYIYFGGGLEKRKNAENLLKAYKILSEKNKKINYVNHLPDLVITGKLMPRLAPLITDVEKIARDLNIAPKVKILGFVPQEDLPALYSNALFFIYPSLYEGFGLPVLESMNVGTPVITSKKSSLPEIGQDAAIYCDPENIEDMAMTMKSMLINPQLRKKLRERGRERAQCFSWAKFSEKTINIIDGGNF